jgi:drug/metabolite transporter (DMT)-like permease
MGTLLGLLTAISWGSSDFLARFATRRAGTLRATLYMQFLGFALLSVALPFLGGWGHLADGSGARPWIWGITGGVLNTFTTLALYRAFEIGRMSVVAPLSAAYPAITVLLSVLTGERLTLARVTGIVFVLPGAVLVARSEDVPDPQPAAHGPHDESARHRSGLQFAVMAAFAMGFMFWLIGVRIVPTVGALPAVWLIRLVSGALTLFAVLALRQSVGTPPHAALAPIVGMAFLDTMAYALNNVGMQLEQVSIISVLASLYGAVTVAYAALLLREKISRTQWLGIVLIFAGIVFISRH